jgi:hypothetical protein
MHCVFCVFCRSDVHCFTLANVLRRPLVLYGGEQAALAGEHEPTAAGAPLREGGYSGQCRVLGCAGAVW